MKSYVLYLYRNMPCEGNSQGRYIGRTESPLTEKAMADLLALKREYAYPPAEAWYASPSTRCVDTLRLLYPRAEPEVVLELAECDFGDWENKTAQELQGVPGFAEWLAGGGQSAPPNGESGPVFFQRVCRGFEMLVQNMIAQGKTAAALVVPAGVMTSILAAYGLPRAQPLDWICDPGFGYALRITPALWMRSQVLEVFDVIPRKPETESTARESGGEESGLFSAGQ